MAEAAREARRLAALRRYEVLDTAPEPGFDTLVALAAGLLGAPAAFVDADRQWSKARLGAGPRETTRALSIRDHAARAAARAAERAAARAAAAARPGGTTDAAATAAAAEAARGAVPVLADAAADPRFAAHPAVAGGGPAGGPGVRFYAGAPIVTPDGVPIGTVCAASPGPRPRAGHRGGGGVAPADRNRLRALTALAMGALEACLAARAAEAAAAAARAAAAGQAALAAEPDHRVEDTLAVVLAIAGQTRRGGGVGDCAEGRCFHAASAAPFAGAAAGADGPAAAAIEAAGPPVLLAPEPAVALAVALHELDANAVRHGALSAPGGRVRVSWTVVGAEDGAPRLRLGWDEAGGPPAAGTPARRGFGTRAIDATVRQQLGGRLETAWRGGGLACAIEAPLRGPTGDPTATVAAETMPA